MCTLPISRRSFLMTSGDVMLCSSFAAAAGLPLFSGVSAAATQSALGIPDRNKTLVFIMLDGGNDSFNMLVPTSGPEFRAYQKSRGNLSLEKQQLLPIKSDPTGNFLFGLHPSLSRVQKLYNNRQLAFIANIGPMIEPVGKSAFLNNAVKLPVGLMSHSDQFKHWQTARPGERLNQGWFGAMADAIQGEADGRQIPMNISLAGSNIMQNGSLASEYSIKASGSTGISIYEDKDELSELLRGSLELILNRKYDSPFKETYLMSTRQAQSQHEIFQKATDKTHVSSTFSDSDLSQQLAMVVKSIKAAPLLGMKHQTYFLRYIGWDHHDELLSSHARMQLILDSALHEFQSALEEEGLAENVITFTGSDFGRTLSSNGNGSDHGWGGNTLVMGSDINGGRVYGKYPSLTLNSELDVGNGVLIPTTSVDELYAELALWFGVQKQNLGTLFPNLSNFYNFNSTKQPLGVVKE